MRYMAFINRASITDCGAMTFTGNTIGLSQQLNTNNAGDRGSVGAFISLDETLQVPTYPIEAGVGTTLNWQENGSRAVLNLPVGSTVLYAELIWGGNYLARNQDISAVLNTPVQFSTPLATFSINPDPITADNFSYVNLGNTIGYYIRSADVTQLVKEAGAGTYSTEGVPGLVEPLIFNTFDTNHAGWTLAVIYYNPTLPIRNMNLFVGAEGIVINVDQPIQDIFISGFLTPSTGEVKGRLLLSAGEGDAVIGGDQMLFGPDLGTLSQVSGPNNPALNFFGSQINGDNGSLDTSGSYGSRNQDPIAISNIYAGRQGWDITNVDVSPYLENLQTVAVVRVTSTGDAYMPNAIGIQIDSTPVLDVTKSSNKNFVNIGETITYTIIIKNVGQVDANDIILTDPIQEGLSLVSGTISVNGVPIANANLTTGVNIGNLVAGSVAIVTYEVLVANDKDLCETVVQNQATLTYDFGCTDQTDSTSSNMDEVIIRCVEVELQKSADTTLAVVGDVITFTTIVTNTGSVTLNNVFFTDPIPENTTFVENSLKINGLVQLGANPEVGVNLGTLNPGESVEVSFSVTLDKISCPARIVNRSYVEYEYQFDSSEPIRTGSEQSNLVIVPVAPTTFKQLSKEENLTIPSQKPDMEEILNVLVEIDITSTRVIRTIVGTSEGGQTLTGYKLIVEGKLNEKVEYIADECEQSVHAAHFKVPFSTFIVLPSDFVEGTEVEIEPYIEDVYYIKIDKRTLFKNVTFNLLAKIRL